ncbi:MULTISPECIES: VOC family protein [unclassified Agrobacterium]|uniref:VOC family protein n=1 Tax=unclassified Agrobacterium TaxID=2632611 RepID=UPI002448B571|nr:MULTISPECIES: VOC family protein [unclassified Agrobacterium]MDH0614212.1 VOC family protein [Agrobacterium sp. GD03872]MDH0695493.1 VOC family protein [Agrobacterium sp. GD03871]MDH1058395.1 VOC family protein [Agrobacterium sp. GD03992]MDH2209663.1 VOC family protein [Agrobacterium sp. GD03643]MDH2219067.1 VOC family protein [Agrobacterium sp. GD03638]
MMKSRCIDHLVLPVEDIGIAVKRLASLGFTVAPEALHPFGTQNACVFFADGAYLEPLAIADPAKYNVSADRGDVFTGRDRAFRQRDGQEGFSALVAKTEDALADHERFLASGVSAGAVFQFSRPVRMPDGSESEAAFRLAFAASGAAADFFLFSCQRLRALPGDRTALERHANGVCGLSEIVLFSDGDTKAARLIEMVFGCEGKVSPDGDMVFVTDNARIRLVEKPTFSGLALSAFGRSGGGLRGMCIVFSVDDLAVTAAALAANGVSCMEAGGRLVAPAAPGQGVAFAFEEK